VIYITNLYRRKISTFFLFKDEILVKMTPTSLHEKKTVWRQWTLNFNFLCGRPHGAGPPPRPHASTWAWPLPLSVDIINGWPLGMCICMYVYMFTSLLVCLHVSCIFASMHVCIYMYLCMYACIFVYIEVSLHVYMYACIYVSRHSL